MPLNHPLLIAPSLPPRFGLQQTLRSPPPLICTTPRPRAPPLSRAAQCFGTPQRPHHSASLDPVSPPPPASLLPLRSLNRCCCCVCAAPIERRISPSFLGFMRTPSPEFFSNAPSAPAPAPPPASASALALAPVPALDFAPPPPPSAVRRADRHSSPELSASSSSAAASAPEPSAHATTQPAASRYDPPPPLPALAADEEREEAEQHYATDARIRALEERLLADQAKFDAERTELQVHISHLRAECEDNQAALRHSQITAQELLAHAEHASSAVIATLLKALADTQRDRAQAERDSAALFKRFAAASATFAAIQSQFG